MAALKSVLQHLKTEGPSLQTSLASRTESLVNRLRAHVANTGVDIDIETFSSWFVINIAPQERMSGLFFAYMRLLGIHVMEGFACFLTTAHSDEDLQRIEDAFAATILAMSAAGFLGASASNAQKITAPLTEPQKEIWMAAQLGDDVSLAFNESFTLDMLGDLNRTAFLAAISEVIERHDALRAYFLPTGEAMIVDPSTTIKVESIDVSQQTSPKAALDALVQAEISNPFDLTETPLVRLSLVRLADDHHAFIFTAHHIVCDGWSMNLILSELKQLYAAKCGEVAAELPKAPSYIEYAKNLATLGEDKEAGAFWTGLFQSPAPVTELPSDRPRPDIRSYAAATTTHKLSGELLAHLKKMAASKQCSLFAALFGGVQVLFGKLSGETDVVVGTPMAGQSLLEDGALVGHCVNFLPQRIPFKDQTPFADHMTAVREQLFLANDHQRYTFGSLLRDLEVKRSLNRMPLTSLQFNYEKIEGGLSIDGLKSSITANPKTSSNFDIFINVAQHEDGLVIDAVYSTSLFDLETVNRWLNYYETLLNAIAAAPDTPIAQLPLLGASELKDLRDGKNQSARDYDLSHTTPARIAERARQVPDAKAVSDEHLCLTFGELDALAQTIARRLAAAGVKRHDRIAVAMDRSANTVAAMFGIWKAGCAYVPIDTNMPQTRIQLILENGDISAVLTDPASQASIKCGSHRMLMISDLLRDHDGLPLELPAVSMNDTAYIMFTSGSTGVPKGVEIPHSALTNLLLSMAEKTGFDRNGKLIAVTTFSFDISVLELFMPLIAGGEVFISSQEEVRSGTGLVQRISEEKPTLLQATPSLWKLLLEAGFKNGKGVCLLAGGEALPRDLADQLLATGAELWNVYGPTETTIWSSAGRVTPSNAITIGDPLANTSLHILDANLRLVPPGVSGDLWIGGAGLAKGYFKRPDLTDGAFRSFSIESGPRERFYKTGDLARRLADGSIQLLGRSDQQVKHRGYRIEIEDIETALRRVPGVADAAVSLQHINSESRLSAFIVSKAANADFKAISDHAIAALPPYMVPTHWEQLAELPLNSSGKLDRKALTAHQPARLATASSQTSNQRARTTTEKAIATIWKEILGIEDLGTNQSFFSLGADSLQLYRIVASLNKQGFEIDARRLMQDATIAELAAELDGPTQDEAEAMTPANDWSVSEETKSAMLGVSASTPVTQTWSRSRLKPDSEDNQAKLAPSAPAIRVAASRQHGSSISRPELDDIAKRVIVFNEDAPGTPIIALNNVAVFHGLAQKIGPANPFYDIPMVPSVPFDADRLRAFEDIAADAVRLIRKVRPSGPYILLGHCVLGTVALEAANQLRQDGETVELVVMNDSWCPGYREDLNMLDKISQRLQLWKYELPKSFAAYRRGEVSTEEYIGQYSLAKKLKLVHVLRTLGLIKHDSDSATLADVENRWYTDYMQVQQKRYRPPPYDGPVAFFRSDEVLLGRLFPEAMGWEHVLKGPLTITSVPTVHARMFRPEGTDVIGEKIRELIDAQNEVGKGAVGSASSAGRKSN